MCWQEIREEELLVAICNSSLFFQIIFINLSTHPYNNPMQGRKTINA